MNQWLFECVGVNEKWAGFRGGEKEMQHAVQLQQKYEYYVKERYFAVDSFKFPNLSIKLVANIGLELGTVYA